jgi:dTDP-4-amino-4,6-dideoxygalactose transaminase
MAITNSSGDRTSGADDGRTIQNRSPVLFAAPDITDEDIAAVSRVLRSGWLTTGAECELLEHELAAYTGARHIIGVSSCTAALEIALAHLRLPIGARVGVPAWTFVSTALAAVHNNLQPVLIDVEASTLNIAPESLEAAIAEGLDAVIAVHFGGVPVPVVIRQLCEDAGLPLIEDAAHALGATDDRGRIGSSGNACFSFYATKNLTSAEGGALATDDDDLAAFARTYRLHGMSADAVARYRPGGSAGYDLIEPGIKANLPDVLAALARSQLRRFDSMQARRLQILRQYRSTLEPAGLSFVPQTESPGSADHLAIVVLPEAADRDLVVTGLKQAGVHPSVHFRPLHQFSWFIDHVDHGPTGLPVCEAMAPRTLSLPLHVGLSDDDVDRVTGQLLGLLHP